MTSSSGASGIGIATITADGTVLDTWFPAPELNADAAAGPVPAELEA
ncbi:MAG: 2,3,4,5-tetrahydropyridine-2,6-dicarboxylate N-succinyltransferase, partial [Mycobacterium sp.]